MTTKPLLQAQGCRRDPWDPHTPSPSCSPSIICQASAPEVLFFWSLWASRCRAAGPSPARSAPRHAARCLAPRHAGNFCGLLLLLTTSTEQPSARSLIFPRTLAARGNDNHDRKGRRGGGCQGCHAREVPLGPLCVSTRGSAGTGRVKGCHFVM